MVSKPFLKKRSFHFKVYFNDDDFIRVGLDEMGYSHKVVKKTIPNCKFIKGRFQIGIFLK
jgi:hypothetical protein